MRVCGKALPPRAALLLTLELVALVLVAPLVFMVPELLSGNNKQLSNVLLSLGRLMAAGMATQAVFYYNDLYNLQLVRSLHAVCVGVLRSFGLLALLLAVAVMVLPERDPVLSRVLLFASVLAVVSVVTRLASLPRTRERVLLLGESEETQELEDTIASCPEWNLKVTRRLRACDIALSEGESWTGADREAALEGGSQALLGNVDRVLVVSVRDQSEAMLQWLTAWKLRGRAVEDAQGFYERATGRVRIRLLSAAEFVASSDYQNGPTRRRVKRAFDLVVAISLLLLTLPLIACVGLLVWMERDGSVVFRQKRVGLHGSTFEILKFRTMCEVARGDAACWADQDRHRITRLGAVLRTYRLDELLQLWNVVRGEMSLVGPRPEQPGFCSMLAENIPFYEQRHTVLPGLTGWAQVKYHYGASLEESRRKLEYDLFYVKHHSLWLDCAIAIETVKVVVTGRGAR